MDTPFAVTLQKPHPLARVSSYAKVGVHMAIPTMSITIPTSCRFRCHVDQDSDVMPITCSELMSIRSERSNARFLHPALHRFKWSSKYP